MINLFVLKRLDGEYFYQFFPRNIQLCEHLYVYYTAKISPPLILFFPSLVSVLFPCIVQHCSPYKHRLVVFYLVQYAALCRIIILRFEPPYFAVLVGNSPGAQKCRRSPSGCASPTRQLITAVDSAALAFHWHHFASGFERIYYHEGLQIWLMTIKLYWCHIIKFKVINHQC